MSTSLLESVPECPLERETDKYLCISLGCDVNHYWCCYCYFRFSAWLL